MCIPIQNPTVIIDLIIVNKSMTRYAFLYTFFLQLITLKYFPFTTDNINTGTYTVNYELFPIRTNNNDKVYLVSQLP